MPNILPLTKVQLDVRNLNKKKRAILRKAVKMGDETVQTLTELGMRHAKSIVPRLTGATANAITRGVYTKKADGTTIGRVISHTPKVHQQGRRNPINLVKWMHQHPSYFKRGEGRYMYRTRGYLNRIKKSVAQSKKQQVKIN